MRLKTFIVLSGILFAYSLIFLNLISAEIRIGNVSGDLNNFYGPGETLKGWINISLVNEPVDSLLTFYDQNITLIDFLRNSSDTSWNCTPRDCLYYYGAVDANSSKTFNITAGNSKVMGLFLRGILGNSVNEAYFNVSSDSGPGCSQQLKIDVTEDNDLDWIPTKPSGDFFCAKYNGSYDSSQQLISWSLDPSMQYCEKIKVYPTPSMQIGADIIKEVGGGTVTMDAYYADSETSIGTCNLPAINTSGEYYCTIANTGFINDTEIYVCIKGSANYKIKGENAGNLSGFFDFQNHVGYTDDYSIFVKGGRYQSIGGFRLDSNSFKSYIADRSSRGEWIEYLKNYLNNKYNNDCSAGCTIPIKFIAAQDQQVTLSNLLLSYGTSSGNRIENNFYDLSRREAKVNSEFLTLNLEAANFKVPDEIRNLSSSIRINDIPIIREDIQIKAMPQIRDLTPKSVPALVPTTFIVLMNVSDVNSTYFWDFGDNSTKETTNKSSRIHTYDKIGSYVISIRVVNKNGETSQTFEIQVISPKNFINTTISGYRTDINNFEKSISTLPLFLKNEVEKRVNLEDIKDEINLQEKSFAEGYSDDEKAVKIMTQLRELKIPTKLFVSQSVRNSGFYMNKDRLDLQKLETLGAGKPNGTRDQYYSKINSWMSEKMNVTFESSSYSLLLRDREDELLFSDLKINLNPMEELKEIYFIVNDNSDKVKFSDDSNVKTKEGYNALIIEDLGSSKTIEFIYPTLIDPLNLPIAISPDFSSLSEVVVISDNCNLNKICEKSLDENYDNCSDCKKPWIGVAIIAIIILLIIFFIVYIILQEWYKRYYESQLFKDKNQLYNLINFINNSEVQNISKTEVFKKLRDIGWNGEQLTYAYNKLHGKRTGMWEIPIFKGSENKKVRQELIKRQQISSNSPPRGFGTGMPPRGGNMPPGRKY